MSSKLPSNLTAKVYYLENEVIKEIRKFSVNASILTNYESLMERISSFFSGAVNKYLQLFWKDEDDDYISVSSDDELQQMLMMLPSGVECLKLYIKEVKKSQPSSSEEPNDCFHPGIICDVCDKNIKGVRYICTVCPNFDLCSTCEGKGIHSVEHDMLCIKKPKNPPMPMPPFFSAHSSTSGSFGPMNNPSFKSAFTSFTPYESEEPSKGSGSKEKKRNSSPSGTPPMFGHVSSSFGVGPTVGVCCTSFPGTNQSANNAATIAEQVAKSVAQNFANNPQFVTGLMNPIMNGLGGNQGGDKASGKCNDGLKSGATNIEEEIGKMAQSMVMKPEFISEMMKPFLSGVSTTQQSPTGEAQSSAEMKETKETDENDKHLKEIKTEGQDRNMEEEEYEKRLQEAIRQMELMGFDNDNGWLKQLLISKDLDIGRVVDALKPPSL